MSENEGKNARKRKKNNDQSDSTLESGNISSEVIEKFLNDQNQLMKKLELMEKEMEEIKDEKRSEPIDTRSNQQKGLSSISMSPRQFIMKHIFKNVSKMESYGGRLFGNLEEHCGVLFFIHIRRHEENVEISLIFDRKENRSDPWTIKTISQFKVMKSNGEVLCKEAEYNENSDNSDANSDFFTFEDMKENYLVDDTLSVEVHVTIKKMTGIYPKNLRNFDKSTEDISDVILVIGNEKFYVSKLTLAAHSSYFKALFLRGFSETTMAEITLNGVDSDDFQKYLEVLYGECAINDSTIEGILHIADMYDTPIIIKKCEEFLLEKSNKKPKKLLEMAVRYNFESLKKKVLNPINSAEDVKEIITGDINDMDPSVLAVLLQKAIDPTCSRRFWK